MEATPKYIPRNEKTKRETPIVGIEGTIDKRRRMDKTPVPTPFTKKRKELERGIIQMRERLTKNENILKEQGISGGIENKEDERAEREETKEVNELNSKKEKECSPDTYRINKQISEGCSASPSCPSTTPTSTHSIVEASSKGRNQILLKDRSFNEFTKSRKPIKAEANYVKLDMRKGFKNKGAKRPINKRKRAIRQNWRTNKNEGAWNKEKMGGMGGAGLDPQGDAQQKNKIPMFSEGYYLLHDREFLIDKCLIPQEQIEADLLTMPPIPTGIYIYIYIL